MWYMCHKCSAAFRDEERLIIHWDVCDSTDGAGATSSTQANKRLKRDYGAEDVRQHLIKMETNDDGEDDIERESEEPNDTDMEESRGERANSAPPDMNTQKEYQDKLHRTCPICYLRYTAPTEQEYRNHMALHNDLKPLKCDQCNERFTSIPSLKSHRSRKHKSDNSISGSGSTRGRPGQNEPNGTSNISDSEMERVAATKVVSEEIPLAKQKENVRVTRSTQKAKAESQHEVSESEKPELCHTSTANQSDQDEMPTITHSCFICGNTFDERVAQLIHMMFGHIRDPNFSLAEFYENGGTPDPKYYSIIATKEDKDYPPTTRFDPDDDLEPEPESSIELKRPYTADNIREFLFKNTCKVTLTNMGSEISKVCAICNQLVQLSELERHVDDHADSADVLNCSLCGQHCPTKKSFRDHLNKHFGFKPYKCLKCCVCFSDAKSFSSHIHRHHPSFANCKETNTDEESTSESCGPTEGVANGSEASTSTSSFTTPKKICSSCGYPVVDPKSNKMKCSLCERLFLGPDDTKWHERIHKRYAVMGQAPVKVERAD